MTQITFVTGGARSGKSRWALGQADGAKRKAFVATAEITDGEMAQRIARHRQERDDAYVTVEAPLDLAPALRGVSSQIDIAVVDCLTVWLGNLMHHRPNPNDVYSEVGDFLTLLQAPPCSLVVVSNETGMGLVPETPLGRRFRDAAGHLNQAVAARADRVVFMVSGIPIFAKG